ncbi:hypothetical protein QM914_09420, partial [Streptococcus australis]
LSTMNTTLDGKTFFKSTLTTPESIDLFEMMAQAVANDRTHLIMEGYSALHIGSSCSVFTGLCRSRATTILVYHDLENLSISFFYFFKFFCFFI